jgi:glutathione S-transferase
LEYQKIEVPRNDKSELIKISGQELVPVLVDNDKVIVDSTDIIEYLEKYY